MRHASVHACRHRLSIVHVGGLFMTSSYLKIRTPHKALKMETPFKMLHGEEADLSHLRFIGARISVHIKDSSAQARRRGLGK